MGQILALEIGEGGTLLGYSWEFWLVLSTRLMLFGVNVEGLVVVLDGGELRVVVSVGPRILSLP